MTLLIPLVMPLGLFRVCQKGQFWATSVVRQLSSEGGSADAGGIRIASRGGGLSLCGGLDEAP